MQISLSDFQETNNSTIKNIFIEKTDPNEEVDNKFKYGQYFTKKEIVRRLIKLILDIKPYDKSIKILEPSFGTRNFISVLNDYGFNTIVGCEIDPNLTEDPQDFFEFSLDHRFDLIIGNPPFTKYNVPESYYYPKNYLKSNVSPLKYLTKNLLKREKEKIENIFILKSLKHLKDKNSTIGFVLPISFFIKNRNKEIKEEIIKKFSTIVIYQNDKVWFDYHIPCCFAIFTNSNEFKNKIIVEYENSEVHKHIFDIDYIHEELIPEVIFNKNNGFTQNSGIPLSKFLSKKRIRVKKSFKENNVSAKNILTRTTIPEGSLVEDYKLAVVRVGNSSVGKCGLINIIDDVLNDMFYVFDFNEEVNKNKELKERICQEINKNQDFFKNITCRVGSKSIKKEDVFNFRITL